MAVMIAPAPLDTTSRAKELIPDKAVVSAHIETIEIRQNKAGDGYYLNIKVNTVDTCPWPDRWLWGMVSLKDTARWSANAFLMAVGFQEDELTGPLGFYDASLEDAPASDDPTALILDVNTFLGELVDVQVVQETYNGETRNKIKAFQRNRVAGAAALMDSDDLPF